MTSTTQVIAKWVICILVFILSACSAGAKEGSPPTQILTQPPVEISTSTPVPTQQGEYTSPLYGYSLKLPEGWTPTASATRLLASGELPEAGFPMVDTFRGPGKKNFMVVAAQLVGPSTTPEAWAKVVTGMSPNCERPTADRTQMEIGGEPALVVVDGSCFGIDHLWLALLHAGRGYHIAWAGDRQQFEEVRASFTFTP